MRGTSRKPLVSVIVPTYNSNKTLRKCLESVHRQTFQNWEIIVVDNFSRDSTVKIAAENGATVIQVKGTPAHARNMGVASASGKYVLFLDSDQVLSPLVIEECVRKCESKGFGMVSIPEVFVGKGFWSACSAVWKNSYQNTERSKTIDTAIPSKPRFFAKKYLVQVGSFNAELLWGEDYDLYTRLRHANVKETFSESKLFHFEDETLKKILLKNIRYGESMPTFAQHTRNRILPRLLLHSFLTFKKIVANTRQPAIIVGCAALFYLKSASTAMGILINAKT